MGAAGVVLVLLGTAAFASASAQADPSPDPTSSSEPTSGVALGLGSDGWSYQQVANGAGPAFEQPSFDASSWPVGTAGFGTTDGTCSFNTPEQVATPWDVNTDLLLRHSLVLPPDVTSARITGTVDNQADVYLNGHLLQHVESGSCAEGTIDVSVPLDALNQPGPELLAVRASDYGVATFFDVQVSYEAPAEPPAPAELTGGVFNGLLPGEDAVMPKKALGNNFACTTGFAVTKDGTTYMLTANHCREWLSKKGKGLGVFASPVDVIGYSGDEEDVTWASGLDCDGGDARCLRPTDPGAADDILAWAPDEGTVTPVAKVVTGQGVLPVLGTSGWNKGQTVCHLVYESYEVCGRVGGFDSATGYAWVKDPGGVASEIDAGGPVYSYVQDGDETTGVRAVGIVEASSRTLTRFYPIAAVKAALGVQVLTGTP